MRTLFVLVQRNTKLFFKDKGMFFSSLITPIILLVLFVTFLGDVYRDAFTSSMPEGFAVPTSLIDGLVGSQIFASIIVVSCITVAFCSNLLLVQDKVTNSITDFTISPVKKSIIALSYYISTLLITLIVCYSAAALCLTYIACVGWYYTFTDILIIIVDIFLLSMFGTALSSIINGFLKTQGQMSAVGTIVSAGYGFICGAYMPISTFGEGLQNILMCLPGTYGTAIFKNHALGGVLREMKNIGIPEEAMVGIKDIVDANIYFFNNKVDIGMMYLVLIGAIVIAVAAFVLILRLRKTQSK